jgi:Dolichyl-phosphate-mannose-protein mannosyltransferase
MAVCPRMSSGWDLLSLSLTYFLAGYLAGWIVLPSPLGAWDRLFISLALSVPATLLAAAPGVATHSLGGWNVALGISVLGAAATWRAWDTLRAFVVRLRSRRLRIGRPPVVPLILIGLAVVVTWFTVLVPEGVENTASGDPNGTIVYYHWGIVGRVVEADGLPATLPEWGRQREFPYEYAFSVLHAAATASLAGGTGFTLEERYRIALVLTAFFAVFALWRRWLPPWWAWLAAVLTLNVSRVETRMLVYKPEAFAFILVIWSAWLFDQALERRSKRWGAMAGVVLAASFLAHPVGSLLVAPLWGGIMIGRAVPSLWRRLRRPRVRDSEADEAPVPGSPVGNPIFSAIAWRPVLAALIVFVLLFGSLRTIIGTTGQNLSQHATNGVDETRVVYNLAYVSANPFAHPRVPECSHPFGVYSTVRPFFSSNASWFFFDVHARSSVLLMVGALILLLGAFLLQAPPRLERWPDSAKRAAITWACYGIGVYLLAVLICVYYSTWVPQRVGPMRLMPYWALIFPIFIAGVAWAASRLLSGLSPKLSAGLSGVDFRGRAGWFGRGVGLVPALVVSAAAIWTFTTISATQDRGVPPFYIAEPRAGGLSDGALQSYQWISRHLPSDALILTNGYEEGALGMLSHRTGLLDGRTPFAQPDPWRSEAIRWLSQSRAFFLRPSSAAVPGGANYVLVARRDVNLGGSFFPTDFRALIRDPDLERIHRFEGVTLYRVRHPGKSSARIDHPSGMPKTPPHRNRLSAARAWANYRKSGSTAVVATGWQPSC